MPNDDFDEMRENRPAPSLATGIAVPTGKIEQAKLSGYEGKLLIIQPLAEEVWETSQSPETAVTVCQIIAVTGYGLDGDNNIVNLEIEDLGEEVPIFWGYVRTQLKDQASPETPWVVGKLRKGRRAFMIDPPMAEDLRAAAVALEEWVNSQEAF